MSSPVPRGGRIRGHEARIEAREVIRQARESIEHVLKNKDQALVTVSIKGDLLTAMPEEIADALPACVLHRIELGFLSRIERILLGAKDE